MNPANKKAYEFAKTICPRSEFKSGRSLLKAAWEIVEPEKRKGQELSVSRLDDEEVNKITLVLCKPNEKGNKVLRLVRIPAGKNISARLYKLTRKNGLGLDSYRKKAQCLALRWVLAIWAFCLFFLLCSSFTSVRSFTCPPNP